MPFTQQLEQVIENVSPETLTAYFQAASDKFRPDRQGRSRALAEDQDLLESLEQLGEIEFTTGDMTRRRSRSAQYAVARKIVKQDFNEAAIFVFYDDAGLAQVRAEGMPQCVNVHRPAAFVPFGNPGQPQVPIRNPHQSGRIVGVDASNLQVLQVRYLAEIFDLLRHGAGANLHGRNQADYFHHCLLVTVHGAEARVEVRRIPAEGSEPPCSRPGDSDRRSTSPATDQMTNGRKS